MTAPTLVPLPVGAGPHQGLAPLFGGRDLDAARAAVILVHGRGGDATGMLGLAREIGRVDLAWIAPRAADSTWYPYRFIAPREANEPGLSSGLTRLGEMLATAEAAGIRTEQVALVGFSQGACLVADFVAAHPKRYGAVAILTGGLIGPPGHGWNRDGDLEGTPIFLGSGDPDPHVPWKRVEETAEVFEDLGARVELERFPGRPHVVSPAELAAVRRLLAPLPTE